MKPLCIANKSTRRNRLATGLPVSILLLALTLALPGKVDATEDTALQAQTRAYITLVYADEARDLEKWEEAKLHYEKALKEYRHIQSTFKEWNDEIITYRVAYCQNQIDSVARHLRPAPQARKPDQAAEYYESKYQAIVQENTYLRTRLGDLEEEVESAENTDELQAELDTIRQENAQLKSGQNTAERAILKDLKRTQEESDQLRLEVDRQKSELAQLKLIRETRDRAAERIEELRTEVASLQQTNQKLGQRLNSSESMLRSQKTKLTELANTPAVKDQTEDLTQLQNQLKNEKNINRQLIQQIASTDSRLAELTASRQGQEAELTQFGKQIATLLGREQDTATTLGTQKKELAALTTERNILKKELSQQVKQLASDGAASSEKFQAMEAEMKASSKRWKDVEDQLQGLEDERKALTQRNVALQAELEVAETAAKAPDTTALDEARKDLNAARKDLAKKDQELNSLRNAKPEISDSEVKLTARLKETETALKAANDQIASLTDGNQALDRDHQAVLKALKQAAADLEQAEQREKEFAGAAKKIERLGDLEKDIGALKIENKTLKTDLGRKDDLLTKQQATSSQQGTELQAISKKHDATLGQVKTLADEKEKLTRSAAALEKQLKDVSESSVAVKEYNALQAQVKKAASEQDSLAKEQGKIEASLNSSIQALSKKLETSEQALTKLTKEHTSQANASAALQKEVKSLTASTVLRSDHEKLQVTLKASTEERDRLSSERNKLEKKLSDIETQHAAFQEGNKKLKMDLKNASKALDGLQDAMEKNITAQTNTLRTEVERLIQELAKANTYRDSLGSITPKDLEKLRRELNSLNGTPAPAPKQAATQETPLPIDTLLREGQQREREGTFEEAIAIYKRLLELSKDHPPSLKGLARIYLQTDQSQLAIGVLEKNTRRL